LILVLSGTSDGRAIVDMLLNKNYNVMVTTATDYGGLLMEPNKNLKILSKRLTLDEMEDLIRTENIRRVIDATHPYAAVVSKNAMEVCERTNVPYLRYERKTTQLDVNQKIYYCKDYDDVIDRLKQLEGNVLLTTGSKELDKFKNVNFKSRLFARVLPVVDSLEKCFDIDLLPKQIIAMQGPFSKALNKAIIQQHNIQILVTKDSSKAGGFMDKVESSLEMNCYVLIIERPRIEYRNVTHDLIALENMLNELEI